MRAHGRCTLAVDALTLAGVDAFYGDGHVLHNVSFSVGQGRLLGLIGRNGAGKTTCMNVAVGLLPPRAGRVAVFATDITRAAPEAIAAHGVALVPQGRRVFRSLSVRENLSVAARRPKGAKAYWTADTVFDMFPRLKERRNQPAALLSGGEQQMLAIGRALMANPRLLLMDEPSEGLAPQIVAEVGRTIARLKGDGLSIVLVEQNIKLTLDLADDIVVLNSGSVVFAGQARDVEMDDAVIAQHLGVH
ncbi:MAG: ABC transporter ATP-binding protein [Hyphomicrobiaceae bacterium]|nr:ABC transporter ATP-binding protein [Hyphomicrobiaceae bacterium]